jgi:hypothetical protein
MHTIAEVAAGSVATRNYIDAAVVGDYSVVEASHIEVAEAIVERQAAVAKEMLH